ncbi:hypothetical protein [Streptomyces sp. NPDC007369]|uniref:hypothetical protein n=1 Tax=Streptomyces sp. NPDC007369 TaxID=3154589 RepID=UPI0033DBE744
MTQPWKPDRGIRHAVIALGTCGVALVAAGAVLDSLWLLGLGTWCLIIAIGMELIYRP